MAQKTPSELSVTIKRDDDFEPDSAPFKLEEPPDDFELDDFELDDFEPDEPSAKIPEGSQKLFDSKPESKPSMFETAYRTIFEPPKIVTDKAHEFGDYMSQPGLNTSKAGAMLQGFLGGATEGVASQLSPANIISMGKGKIPTMISRALGAAQIGHGAQDIYEGNTARGIGDIGFGALGTLPGGHANVPEERPSLILKDPAAPKIPDDFDKAMKVIADYGDAEKVMKMNPQEIVDYASALAPDQFGVQKHYKDDVRPEKPRVRRNQDGTYTSLDDPTLTFDAKGNVLNKSPKNVYKLPTELSGAKPRFNIGTESYIPTFENDLDKALFIIAQKNPSKRDADYLKFVMDSTGLDEASARAIGGKVRMTIYNLLKGSEAGEARIPDIVSGIISPEINKPVVPKIEGAGLDAEPELPTEPQEVIHPPGIDEKVPVEKRQVVTNEETPRQRIIRETLNFPRSIMASYDLSAPLRQGIGMIHKKEFWTSLDDMIKSWGPEGYKAVQESIKTSPTYKMAIDNGLFLAEHSASRSAREEQFLSSWADKIPGVAASNRAYTGFLNKLRMDSFNSLVQNAQKAGIDVANNGVFTKTLADYVNTATGRGSLGKLEDSKALLQATLFSPRLIASRLKMLNPNSYLQIGKEYGVMSKEASMMRREYLKSALAIATVSATINGLAKAAGAEVSLDPTSSDFAKAKIGKTRLDPNGGFQQYLVLLSRLKEGATTSSTTGKRTELGNKYGAPNRLDIVERFGESKLNPVMSFAIALLKGKDYQGQPINVTKEVATRFLPLIMQDIYQLAKEDPEMLPLMVPAGFGMGIQSY